LVEKTKELQIEKLASDDEALLAETLFNIAHYNEEYESAASLADIAFELTEVDKKVHRAVTETWKEGAEIAETALSSLEEEGHIEKCDCGGWKITPAGEEWLDEHLDKLGHTFESEEHAGQVSPDEDSEMDIEDEDEDEGEEEVEEVEEIDEEPEDEDMEDIEEGVRPQRAKSKEPEEPEEDEEIEEEDIEVKVKEI
jgi:hypothetical protein